MKESGRCEEQPGSITALMAATPSPALSKQSADGARKSQQRGAGPTACTPVERGAGGSLVMTLVNNRRHAKGQAA